MQFAAKYAESTTCTLQADMVLIYIYYLHSKKTQGQGDNPKAQMSIGRMYM